MGRLAAGGAGPFVIRGHRDEAAASGDGLAPHRAVEIVAAGVVDRSQSFALEAPPHRDGFTACENNGGRIGTADEAGLFGEMGGAKGFGFTGGVEGVAHRSRNFA